MLRELFPEIKIVVVEGLKVVILRNYLLVGLKTYLKMKFVMRSVNLVTLPVLLSQLIVKLRRNVDLHLLNFLIMMPLIRLLSKKEY